MSTTARRLLLYGVATAIGLAVAVATASGDYGDTDDVTLGGFLLGVALFMPLALVACLARVQPKAAVLAAVAIASLNYAMFAIASTDEMGGVVLVFFGWMVFPIGAAIFVSVVNQRAAGRVTPADNPPT